MSQPDTKKYQLTTTQQRTMVRAVALAEVQLRSAKEIVADVFSDLSPALVGSMSVALAQVIASNYGHVITEKS